MRPLADELDFLEMRRQRQDPAPIIVEYQTNLVSVIRDPRPFPGEIDFQNNDSDESD